MKKSCKTCELFEMCFIEVSKLKDVKDYKCPKIEVRKVFDPVDRELPHDYFTS